MILLFPFRRKCFISVKGKKTYCISFTVHEKWDIHLFLTNAVYDLHFREEQMQVLNKTTINRMAWLSFLSIVFSGLSERVVVIASFVIPHVCGSNFKLQTPSPLVRHLPFKKIYSFPSMIL